MKTLTWQSLGNKFIAIIALINLLIALFDLSYLPLRDFYFQQLTPITYLYDPVKSISPHPDIEHYLQTVNLLAEEIEAKGIQTNTTFRLFSDLRQQSNYLLTENPFLAANKFSTFAKLQHRMRRHLDTPTAEAAFDRFWSQEYFLQIGADTTLTYFEHKIQPLLESNYLRDVGRNGQFVDYFWRIDLYFIIFFAIEFLARTFWHSSRQANLNWRQAMLRSWYYVLMLLPIWRWLRIIPVTVRLHKSRLIDLETILAEMTYEPAAYLANRVSNFLMVRLINQTQEAVSSGEAARLLLTPEPSVPVTQASKFDAIVDRLLQLSIYQVLPELQPEVEALLRHILQGAFQDSDFYKGLTKIPGMEMLPAELTENLADFLAQGTYELIASAYSDLEGKVLFERLTTNFKLVLSRQLAVPGVQSELQGLLTELLEEVKLNYVKTSAAEEPEKTLAEAEQIRSDKQSDINSTV